LGGSQFEARPGKKISKIPLQPMIGHSGVHVIPATQEKQIERLQSRPSLGINARHYLKNNENEKGWGCGLSDSALA
jgi:hypothetical protein